MIEDNLPTIIWMVIAAGAVFCLFLIACALNNIAQALCSLSPIGEAISEIMEEIKREQSDEDDGLHEKPVLTTMRRLWERI
jgi:hypothetical protein